MSDLTKRFSEGAKRALGTALSLAKEMGHSYIGSEHLLAGIAVERNSTASRLLSFLGICCFINSDRDVEQKEFYVVI